MIVEAKGQALEDPRKEELKTVSKQFEALFVQEMISAMRKTVNEGGLIPQGQGEKIYRSMLDQHYAESIAESEQIGLSSVIYQQLARNLEQE